MHRYAQLLKHLIRSVLLVSLFTATSAHAAEKSI